MKYDLKFILKLGKIDFDRINFEPYNHTQKQNCLWFNARCCHLEQQTTEARG